jgi:signal transduction protein with GAF and PtsI domain
MAQTMGYPDIDRAREAQAALRRVIDAYAGPGADLRALRRVVDLCREMTEAMDDAYCREKIRALAEYAAELLSRSEHRARGALSGADFLRRQIGSALELVQSRLYSLERARRVGSPAFARAILGAEHAFKR